MANNLVQFTEDGHVATPMSTDYDYVGKLATLTDEEKSHYNELTSSINTHDLTTVQNYGAELSAVISATGDNLLKAVKASNSNEIVQLSNTFLTELKKIDLDDLDSDTTWRSWAAKLPFIGGKIVSSIDKKLIEHNTVSENLNEIGNKMGAGKIVALRDNSTLQQIYDADKTYKAQMQELIIAAKLKLVDIEKEIEEMKLHPSEHDAFDIQERTEFKRHLEKRVDRLLTSKFVMEQNLIQIRALQGNNVAIADQYDELITHVLPLWRHQLSIALIMNNQSASVDVLEKMGKATNEMLIANSASLKQNSIAIAKANENPVIALNTLKKVSEDLITTVNTVNKIHAEAAKNAGETERVLRGYAEKIENALLPDEFSMAKAVTDKGSSFRQE